MTDVTHWLRAKAHGFNHLSNEEVDAISDFSLLWALFESRLLNSEGSARAICDLVDGWQKDSTLDATSLDPELAYFRQRYFDSGAFTDHFGHLHVRRNDQEPLVLAVVDGSDNDPRNRVAAVLIIIFRYRNNLFHGVKWQYQLAGQVGNFATANAALMKTLDRHGALLEG
ncbi:MAG: hypothetical protein EOS76_01240 [Mesorhizobium sp.]|uniref:hypothetical protein n=1 Tax=unclassified Mesorhizobium TaxID=325217 RepID=UPI000F75368E|nr:MULTISPECIES: hypothetical protein [unclassified Mesorhizobium]RVC67734.1 hypothetical protein EN766_31310 [Mesorhizobium sp. M2A.F.Ca.ET.046.02.1.1]AZO34227.1 hypothetical protein EJ072_06945 [Mesorhizobium sp. M2A.F.Ca.ET.046.03.2.1]AZO71659.1 hypothetical protein EJ067_11320 [Mesorhizobium sp. M1D.F.Ca.ET.043.01.1.1]RWB49763.1 MAG: hypothetical protein EOQ44_01150 [Mesorhizobium sp.]RWE22459.1 MAG: hypothetical protein EOS76_01240 [Mesorhizobium sp.]